MQKKTALLGGLEFNLRVSALPLLPNCIRILDNNNKDQVNKANKEDVQVWFHLCKNLCYLIYLNVHKVNGRFPYRL
ncbi:MAG: hypothetical protein CSB13_03370 [Chloroflexi bacterium]|nr:MAG: hypothetical protein CSB13_03370 [Chloroflexota bacterium]